MIGAEISTQLKDVFQALEGEIELVVSLNDHQDGAELLDLLEDVASTSTKIKVTKEIATPGAANSRPSFSIRHNGQATGVRFSAIPGGHEFTSLIVAILNADGKGKLPETALAQRIRRLKGPIKVNTFISLSCENCPDVVQALNQMALIHPQFEHETIDGIYAQDELQSLGIQGVPSVVVGKTLVHSGRISFVDLLSKLEQHFGTEDSLQQTTQTDLGRFDVAVLGGGPAGVSAAIYSARKGLKTCLVAERIGGQVQETRGIENFVSVLYTEGPQLANRFSEHLRQYPVEIFENRRATSINLNRDGNTLTLDSGETFSAAKLIVATGAKWRELGVEGEKEYLGRGVAFCPHCDGPFYKGKKIAVIGGGNSGVEAAIDLSSIVKEVVLIEYAPSLNADKVLIDKLLSLANVSVMTNIKTTAIVGNGQKVTELKFENRAEGASSSVELDGVFVQIGLVPNSQFLQGIVELSKFGEVEIDSKCRTSRKGIYAAGDVTTVPYKQIVTAMGEGAKAALAAYEDSMIQQS